MLSDAYFCIFSFSICLLTIFILTYAVQYLIYLVFVPMLVSVVRPDASWAWALELACMYELYVLVCVCVCGWREREEKLWPAECVTYSNWFSHIVQPPFLLIPS